MIEFLIEAYPSHYRSTQKITIEQIHISNTDQEKFELTDSINYSGLSTQGEGIAVFSNPTKYEIEIINFEKYINLFNINTLAGKGKKCDFLLHTKKGIHQCIICAELTKSKEDYLDDHLVYGSIEPRKRAKAVTQLEATINKLADVPEIGRFIEQHETRTGLFAFRLSGDENIGNPVALMNIAFNQFSEVVPELQTEALLPWGFVFSQRKYPAPFII
jgi:plasmid stabilization system protein ParE